MGAAWEQHSMCESAFWCESDFGLLQTSAFIYNKLPQTPIPVTVRYKACVYGGWLSGIAGSNSAGCMYVGLLYYVFSCRSLCFGLIARQEESFRVCVCMRVCECARLVECNQI